MVAIPRSKFFWLNRFLPKYRAKVRRIDSTAVREADSNIIIAILTLINKEYIFTNCTLEEKEVKDSGNATAKRQAIPAGLLKVAVIGNVE